MRVSRAQTPPNFWHRTHSLSEKSKAVGYLYFWKNSSFLYSSLCFAASLFHCLNLLSLVLSVTSGTFAASRAGQPMPLKRKLVYKCLMRLYVMFTVKEHVNTLWLLCSLNGTNGANGINKRLLLNIFVWYLCEGHSTSIFPLKGPDGGILVDRMWCQHWIPICLVALPLYSLQSFPSLYISLLFFLSVPYSVQTKINLGLV